MASEASKSPEEHKPTRSMHCWLCGATIDRKYAEHPDGTETWRAYAQELAIGEPCLNTLVEPGLCPLTISGEPRFVHQACYHVLTKRVFGELSAKELNALVDCMRDIAPFLPPIPCAAAPDRLDEDIAAPDLHLGPREGDIDGPLACFDRKTIHSENIQASPLLSLLRHEMPADLDDLVSESLNPSCNPNKCADPQLADFLAAASWFRGVPGFDDGPEDQQRGKIAQALRNFHGGGPARFPHTANYSVVERNVLTIVLRYLRLPLEAIPSEGWDGGERRKVKGYHPKYIEHASGVSALYVRVYTLRRDYYAGDGGHGSGVGARYLRDIRVDRGSGDTASSEKACGALRVAVDSPSGIEFTRDDAVGVARVRVQDARGWKTAFESEGVTDWGDETRISRSEAEWRPNSAAGAFFIVADVSWPWLPRVMPNWLG